MTVTASEFRS